MRLIVTLAILAFPIVEIWILIKLFQQYGLFVLLYLVVVGLLGLQLIRDEKLLFSGRIMQNLSQGVHPFKVMFGSAKNIFAGVLLIIPGVMTDVIAIILLLIPINNKGQIPPSNTSKAANEDVIEGEFRRED